MICDLDAEILPSMGKDPDDHASGLIGVLHTHAEQLVKDFVGSRVEQGTYTEILPPYSPSTPGDLASESPTMFFPVPGALQLRNTPVRSVVSVHETNTPGGGGWPAAALLGSLDYWLDQEEEEGPSRSGLLYRSSGAWPAIGRNIRVQYVGGWTPDELEGEAQAIKLAVKQTAVKLFREAEAYFDNASGGAGVGPLTSEAIMGWNQGYDAESLRELVGMRNDLPASAKQLLWPFVNYGRKLGSLR